MVEVKKKNKKRGKVRIKPIGAIIIILIIAIFAIILLPNKTNINLTKTYEKLLASEENTINTFTYNEETKNLETTSPLPRNTKVKTTMKDKITKDQTNYIKVKYDGKEYYINEDNLVNNEKEVVKEKERYVRTSVTIYTQKDDYKITSFAKKGSKLDVVGFDEIKKDGTVNKYKIKYEGTEGWVYSKYLVSTSEKASENYNENNVYDIHKDRKYTGRELYGGKASTLDYYPNEKPNFEDNPLQKEAKTMYLNSGVINNIDAYLQIATTSGVNAIVVDIKDGVLGYPSEVAKEYSPTAYANAINSIESYKNAIKKIKDAGIYTIGRIVVFNDSHYGKDHPEDCIKSTSSSRLWPSVYSRGAWEYNVALAKDAVQNFGFNEIQYDYVRFPEDAYNMSVNAGSDFKNKYNEEKAEAVQNFLFYATDQMHELGVYLSVDVFGECSGEYVTAYGQYWPAISNVVDAISSMPYTDHFGRSVDTWSNPYNTVLNWAKGAAQRQTEIPTPAIPRTWITAYDTPYWKPTIIYNESKIEDQVRALYDAGLKGGFLTWNGKSDLSKYEQIKGAFSKNYN